MDHQELLRNYDNALNIAEVDSQSTFVWRTCKGRTHSRKLRSMFSTK